MRGGQASPLSSKVLGGQSGVPGDSLQHSWPDLIGIVEGEHEIGPSLPAQHTVGAAPVTFDRPAFPQQSGENAAGLRRRPAGHAAAKVMSSNAASASPCSSRSASTRSARAFARAVASSGEAP